MSGEVMTKVRGLAGGELAQAGVEGAEQAGGDGDVVGGLRGGDGDGGHGFVRWYRGAVEVVSSSLVS
jgi:hypothetical protein